MKTLLMIVLTALLTVSTANAVTEEEREQVAQDLAAQYHSFYAQGHNKCFNQSLNRDYIEKVAKVYNDVFGGWLTPGEASYLGYVQCMNLYYEEGVIQILGVYKDRGADL